MDNKILVIVQCRYDSTRLPGKALYPFGGTPVLAFLLRRLQINLPEEEYEIVLATTTGQQDNIINAWGLREGVQVLRGKENDVLSRYITCLKQYPAEIVVRVTADNPLTCPEMLIWTVHQTQAQQADYAQVLNLPYGTGIDVFSASVLQHLDQEVTAADEREHINLHIYRNREQYNTLFLNVEGELARPDLRMTIDTKEDWERVSAIIPDEPEPWRISLAEAIIRMDSSSVT